MINNTFEFNELEIGDELKKFGYVDIPLDQIKQFKKDLEILVKREQFLNGFKDISSNENQFLISHDNTNSLTKFNQFQNTKTDTVSNKHANIAHDLNLLSLNLKSTQLENDKKNNFDDKIYQWQISNDKNMELKNSLNNQKRMMDYDDKKQIYNKNDNQVYSDENCSASANTNRIFKRKILRKINGHRIVEESLTDDNVSEIGSSSRNYIPDYDHLQTNKIKNTAKLSEMSTDINENENTKSVLRPNSSRCYRKKCDPVKRYHLYKEAWELNKAPGEKAHKQLRWDIRAQMYYADELPIKKEQPQRKQGDYIIPTEKKREKLCWKIRQDLDNGHKPTSILDYLN